MNHKSIIGLISSIFFVGIILSVISIFTKMIITPEVIFMVGFIVLIVTCILFFHTAEIVEQKPDHKALTTVINKNLYICPNTKTRRLTRLFIKVSILFM